MNIKNIAFQLRIGGLCELLLGLGLVPAMQAEFDAHTQMIFNQMNVQTQRLMADHAAAVGMRRVQEQAAKERAEVEARAAAEAKARADAEARDRAAQAAREAAERREADERRTREAAERQAAADRRATEEARAAAGRAQAETASKEAELNRAKAEFQQKEAESQERENKIKRQALAFFYVQQKLTSSLRDIFARNIIRDEGMSRILEEACRLSQDCASLQNVEEAEACRSSQDFCASFQNLKQLRSVADEFDAESNRFEKLFWIFLMKHPDLVGCLGAPAIGVLEGGLPAIGGSDKGLPALPAESGPHNEL